MSPLSNFLPVSSNNNMQYYNPTETEINEILSSNNSTLRTKNLEKYDPKGNTTVSSIGHLDNSNKTSNALYTCYDGNDKVSLPIFPNFIIVGAQKAGTTAISEIMDKVPNFLGTIAIEAHYWDKLAGNKSLNAISFSSAERCRFLRDYYKKWDSQLVTPDTILFEKTPRLLAMPDVPEFINHLLPHKPKIIVILRNPVDRLCSQFKMEWQVPGKEIKGSFEDKLKKSLNHLKKRNAIRAPPYSNITTEWNQADFGVGRKVMTDYSKGKAWGMVQRGFYAQQIRSYMKVFPINEMLKVIHYENFQENKATVLQDLVEFVGGPSSFKFRESLLQKDLGPKKRKKEVWYPPIMNKTKIYLKHLYKPFNDELADLLGESWRGVWD